MTTDEPDAPLDPLSPADEARIRALLADARETGPVPAHVAARLDDALAGLAAERHRALDSGYQGTVTPLVRTRRHRVAAVLGAAAAVAVVGLAIGTFFDGDGGAGGDSMSAGSDVDRGEAPEEADAEAHKDDDAGLASTLDSTGIESERVIGAETFAVRSRQLGRALSRIRDDVLGDPRAVAYAGGLTYLPEGFECRRPPVEGVVLVGVRYDGGPAYAAFEEPMGDAQVVEVLQCGTGAVVRSTTLPVPE